MAAAINPNLASKKAQAREPAGPMESGAFTDASNDAQAKTSGRPAAG